jgi:putative FmdB family regulatory protein
MPLFDYRCRRCNSTFELLVRSSGVPTCPACGTAELEKLVSRPAPPGKSAGILKSARTQATREGHFSHYAPAERPKAK